MIFLSLLWHQQEFLSTPTFNHCWDPRLTLPAYGSPSWWWKKLHVFGLYSLTSQSLSRGELGESKQRTRRPVILTVCSVSNCFRWALTNKPWINSAGDLKFRHDAGETKKELLELLISQQVLQLENLRTSERLSTTLVIFKFALSPKQASWWPLVTAARAGG